MKLKILLVDDDDLTIFLHNRILSRCGLTNDVIAFGNSKSALDYLQENETVYDVFLVLLDINMPGMNGWDFLKAMGLIAFREKVKVILITSSVDKKDKSRAGRFPQVVDFLEKPLNLEKCEQIKQVINNF